MPIGGEQDPLQCLTHLHLRGGAAEVRGQHGGQRLGFEVFAGDADRARTVGEVAQHLAVLGFGRCAAALLQVASAAEGWIGSLHAVRPGKELLIDVVDDGIDPTAARSAAGCATPEERARECGGQVTVHREARGGTG